MAEHSTAGHSEAPRRASQPDLNLSSFTAPRRLGETRTARDLHVCPSCNSELVYPIDWAPADRGRWMVALRCPECEWNGGGIHRQEVVDRFDEALERGTESVLDDLRALARANMLEEIDAFATALHADQILPEDF
jgi:hypothetical protein